MAKKTRKVLKQESQQRARQQAVANVNAAEAAVATAAVAATPAAPARVAKVEVTDEQDFAHVRSDVRRSLTLAGIFAVAMIVLSFIVP
jgi:predicted neutral ceramidase superfamily lipid hydrolase